MSDDNVIQFPGGGDSLPPEVADKILELLSSERWIMYGLQEDGDTIIISSEYDPVSQLGLLQSAITTVPFAQEEEEEK